MYESLGQNIAKRLEAKDSPAAEGDTPMHRATVKALTSVKDYNGLLDAVAALEALVAANIGLELTRYDWGKPIAGQTDGSKTIADYARIVFDAYRMVTTGAAKSIATPTGDLATVVGRIRVAGDAPGMDTKPVQEFMAAVRDYIVLSLWVAARSEPGRKLVTGYGPEQRVARAEDHLQGRAHEPAGVRGRSRRLRQGDRAGARLARHHDQAEWDDPGRRCR